MGKGFTIGGIVAIVFVLVIVVAILYESPIESTVTNEKKALAVGEPYWTQPIDTMKDKVVGSYIPPSPLP